MADGGFFFLIDYKIGTYFFYNFQKCSNNLGRIQNSKKSSRTRHKSFRISNTAGISAFNNEIIDSSFMEHE